MKNLRWLTKNKKRLAYLIAIGLFMFLMVVCFIFIYNYSMRVKEDNENKVTESYYILSDEIREFKNQNISILSGFAAYIQLVDTTDGDEIYRYLDFLLRDRLEDIRNIGVFEDTTIKWVYPLEGNEGAIGTDLSKNPEQIDDVLRVKNNLETLFVGPVNLIQGGQSFIVRMPLLKNEKYWGMVSIVLKAERAFSFVEKHSKNYKMEYLITSADKPDEIIHGNKKVLDMSPLKFRTEYTLGGWDIYAAPKGGWDKKNSFIVLIIFLSSITSFLLSWRVFSWINKYNQVFSDKAELESKYILDRFTGIYTREYFNFRLKEAVSQGLRNNEPIAMIFFDLDHFKHVNDVYGHSAGDDVLLEVVKKIKYIIRGEDVFARWGGDEFILLLPNTNLESAIFVAERIRTGIESLEINQAYGVTASIGCSQWKPKEYIESWFLRTDQALYDSKNTGKNKVTISDTLADKNVLVKIDWNDSYNSGCSMIDDEHKAILERCNIIVETALEQSSFDETLRHVEQLIIEMQQHFDDEINLLYEVGYPEVENHKRIHEALLSKTKTILQKTIQREISAVEFFTFLLLTVVEGHFKNEDVKYFEYINKEKK